MTSSVEAPLSATSPTSVEAKKRDFRPEIQALRAAAVLGVVVNHLAPERLTGGYVGVDVFFVISGYLITAHLLSEVARTGGVKLAGFWARRARRLLPASLLVLLVSAVGTLVLLPISDWQDTMRQIGASAIYVQNWILAADATDYFASANSASPVTHFWSLSAEEQFYLVWPLLIVLAAFITRKKLARHRRTVLIVVLAAVTVASFAFSIAWTSISPNSAYFITPTRAWEFGVGGLVAAVGLRVPRRIWMQIGLSWIGWAAIAFSFLRFDAFSGVPGWVALLPVLGTVAVLAARSPEHPWAPTPFASSGPVQFLGDISYSLYLWHWPLIVFAHSRLGSALSIRVMVVLFLVSVGLAWATKKYVEDVGRTAPWLAKARPRRTLVATGIAMVAMVAITGGVWGNLQGRVDTARDSLYAQSADPAACFGAAAFTEPGCDPGRTLTDPDAVLVNAVNQQNRVEWGSTCQQDRDVPAVLTCEFGVPRDDADRVVALTGDSHAGQWVGALDKIAVERNWNVVMYVKSSCAVNLDPLLTAGFYPAGAESCRTWAASVVDEIAADPDIDLVITSSIARQFVEMDESGAVVSRDVSAGYRDAWDVWLAAGKKVAVVADVPTMNVGDVPDCVARNLDDTDPCRVPADVGLPGDSMVLAADGIDDDSFVLVDMLDAFCDSEDCHSVGGGVLMYGDANHVSNTYARTLSDELDEQLDSVR